MVARQSDWGEADSSIAPFLQRLWYFVIQALISVTSPLVVNKISCVCLCLSYYCQVFSQDCEKRCSRSLHHVVILGKMANLNFPQCLFHLSICLALPIRLYPMMAISGTTNLRVIVYRFRNTKAFYVPPFGLCSSHFNPAEPRCEALIYPEWSFARTKAYRLTQA